MVRTDYTFNPTSNEIVFGSAVEVEKIKRIHNLTTKTVIFDSTEYISQITVTGTTLSYATDFSRQRMKSSDVLRIDYNG